MNSVHRNTYAYNNYLGFTPQKFLSTQLTNISYSSKCKQSMSPNYDLTKSNGVLEVQSMISFGQQQIKQQQIQELFKTMQLIRFLNKENKSLMKTIRLKTKYIQTLQQKREHKIKEIQEKNKKTQLQYEYFREKVKQIRLKNKQRQNNINYQIKLMKQKIRRVKSLGYDHSLFTQTEISTNSNRNEAKHKYKHRRQYSQSSNHYQPKKTQNNVFIPVYYPYPIMAPYNQPQRNWQLQAKTRRSEYSIQKEYPQMEESRLFNGEKNNHINIKKPQREQQKISEFSNKLRESLVNKQSKRYNRKSSRKTQNLQSLRNSCKTNSSKGVIKPKVYETDQDMHQDEYENNYLTNKKSGYSKMGIKITTSNMCEDQIVNYKHKRFSRDFTNMQIAQQLQNSTIHLDIPSDKKQNSSWEKQTIQKSKNRSVKHNQLQMKSKQKTSDKQLSAIQIVQSDQNSSFMNTSQINIIVTQSPYTNTGLQKQISYNQEKNVINTENKQFIEVKELTKLNKSFQKASWRDQRYLKTDLIQQSTNQMKDKQLANSQIQINDISAEHTDQDSMGSITLMPESKISRNSQPKKFKDNMNPEYKGQDDQILGSINLVPESRISRLSRQKQALKVSRSQLKQANVFQTTELKTSISDIRSSDVLHTIQNPLASSEQNEPQLIQYQSELRSTTPSRIVQKSKKPKKQSKKIEYMSGSIEQASEEEQNLVSQILLKNSRRSRQTAR